MSILYIDDDTEDVEFFHDAVKAVNPAIRYASAQSGKDALSYLNSTDVLPDHIILDINMPDMDGRSCLREIRRIPRLSYINIIVYSTHSYPADVRLFEAMGARFMQKANSFNDLCAMIRSLTNNQ